MKNVEDYLKDNNGNPSSTRLFSMWTLKFFFFWASFSSLMLIVFALILGKEAISLIAVLGGNFLFLDILCLLAAFAPKQLNKIQEIRAILEQIKNGK